MQFKTAFALFAAVFPAVYSAAVEVVGSLSPEEHHSDADYLFVEQAKRDNGNVYVCTDANFEGSCENLSFANGFCENLAPTYERSISSLGPDPNWECTFFK